MNEQKPAFGSRLERIMKVHKASVSDFASALQVSRTTVYEWIKQDSTPEKAIGAVLRAYPNVNVRWLDTGEGEMFLPDSEVQKEESGKAQADLPWNAGVIVRDARSGKVWFTIDFPDYMTVVNPMIVETEVDTGDVQLNSKERSREVAAEPN